MYSLNADDHNIRGNLVTSIFKMLLIREANEIILVIVLVIVRMSIGIEIQVNILQGLSLSWSTKCDNSSHVYLSGAILQVLNT